MVNPARRHTGESASLPNTSPLRPPTPPLRCPKRHEGESALTERAASWASVQETRHQARTGVNKLGLCSAGPMDLSRLRQSTSLAAAMNDYSSRPAITGAEITAGLRRLGLRPGDLVHVHSSLSSLGYVIGGAEAVVDALLAGVGPEGTVMVPTFNHGRAEIFDVRSTPSVSGAITEALWRRPQARRSVHPTHPLAAIGPLARQLTQGHLELRTFDADSPLGRCGRLGGWVLLLGVGMNVNTSAHVGETIAEVPCLGFRQFERKVRRPDGRVETAWSVLWRDGPCRIEWQPLERLMRKRGLITDGRIGQAEVHLMKCWDVIACTLELTKTLCPGCPTRPARR